MDLIKEYNEVKQGIEQRIQGYINDQRPDLDINTLNCFDIENEWSRDILMSEEDLEHHSYDLGRFIVLKELLRKESIRNDFEISSVSRKDLKHIGFDISNVDNTTMEKLASKLSDDYCNQLYWSSLEIIATHLKIPKIKNNE